MQEYEEEFYFEEDKIDFIAMWAQSAMEFHYYSFRDIDDYENYQFTKKPEQFEDRNQHISLLDLSLKQNNINKIDSDLLLSCSVEDGIKETAPSFLKNNEEATQPNQVKKIVNDDKDESIEGQEDLLTECIHNDLRQERYQLIHQNLLGMTITSGNVTVMKDESNLIGISIGGGAPLCPCLYIVQVFDNTPASKEGTLQSGDELVGVNGQSVKGKTKVEVAKMIQSAKEEVNINYNKLHADPQQGKTLDIVMKKVKHRLVENMSTTTADALGLSRAILCNDTLVKKLQELQNTEQMYKGLVEHAKRMLKAYFDLLQTYKNFGDAFASIGVREPQPRASEAFSQFGGYHRQMEKDGIKMLKAVKPILSDMGTYLHKAIPDTKLTIKKYADTKFEYLSYCLKVKEMDDEEYSYSALQEPLYRVETGNYEYRLVLRCRQDARNRFARLRSDVLVKMELLDNKHVQDVVWQLQRFISGLAKFHDETLEQLKGNGNLFPVEVDLTQNAFQYKSTMSVLQDNPEDDEDTVQEIAREIMEHYDMNARRKKKELNGSDKDSSISSSLLPDLEDGKKMDNLDSISENTSLLAELGLADTETSPFDASLMNDSPFDMSGFDSNSTFFNIDLTCNNPQKCNLKKDGFENGGDLTFGAFLSHANASGPSSNNLIKKNDSSSNLLAGFD